MDGGIQQRPYPSMNLAALRAAVAAGHGTPAMVAEIERREAVAAGDDTRMTESERLTRRMARVNGKG